MQRRWFWTAAVFAALTAGSLAPSAARAGDGPAVEIPYERFTLDNGLEVLLSEDHDIPVVRVELWYHVGSKDEVPGRTGFAHLFEHLMFQGSKHANADYFVPLQEVGASVNGSTNMDRTNYYEQLPSEYLPLALWMEADRMGHLLDVLDQERLTNQQGVVRNERRQNYDNRPYGDVWITLRGALYPEGHPYHHPTIGSHEDIEAATLEDVHTFFRTHYVPDNATLTVVGDFDPATIEGLVTQMFGGVPAGGLALQGAAPAPATLTEQVVIRKQDAVPVQKVWIAWHSPAFFAAGDAELDLLANLLGDGKQSRLYAALVHDQQIAKDISARQSSNQYGSVFYIQATAAKGHDTDEIVEAVDTILEELRQTPPSEDELAIGRIQFERDFIYRVGTIAGRSAKLQSYNHFVGDPGYIASDLARYQHVTVEGVHQAMQRWLPADRRVVLHVVPEPEEADGTDAAGEGE
jgi:zinc protease